MRRAATALPAFVLLLLLGAARDFGGEQAPGVCPVAGSNVNNGDSGLADEETKDQEPERPSARKPREAPRGGEGGGGLFTEPPPPTGQRRKVFRGANNAAKGEKSAILRKKQQEDLSRIFDGLAQTMGSQGIDEDTEEVRRLDELLDRVFIPRLQSAPKYKGALECVNEALYRDVLGGPKKKNRSPQLLQQAYAVMRNPPVALAVPVFFVEMREAADRYIWDAQRARTKLLYERRGQPVPEKVLLPIDDYMAMEAEEPRVREEELSPEEEKARGKLIDGWLKQQYRLRLYYLKRIGKLEGQPQDILLTFTVTPSRVAVTVEEIEGLSYGAELDPEPADDDSDSD